MNKGKLKSFLYPHLNGIFVVALVGAILVSAVSFTTGKASTIITVTTTTDSVATDGKCSLREAIISADKDQATSKGTGECPAGSGVDTIVIPAGTYPLTKSDSGNEDAGATGDLDIYGDVNIQGAGADKTFVDASKITDHVFQIIGSTVKMTGMTIQGGNTKKDGGGIYNSGTLTLVNVTLRNNTAVLRAGGLYNAKGMTLTINGSTLSGNTAGDNGGAIMNDGGTVNLINSTLSANTTKLSGGGIYNGSGTTSLLNTTVTNNTADSDANSTGDGGGGFSVVGGTLSAKNSIIAGNFDKSTANKILDCAGTLTSQGYNLVQNTGGCTISGVSTGNLTGVNPNLGVLANNGGTTQTHALLPSSPAVENGTNTGCPATDQRGVTRPQGITCDMGAFELEDPPQRNPFTVNVASDSNDGFCTFLNCSLREAISAANASPNGTSPDSIQFKLPGSGPFVIQPSSPLPALTEAVNIDATTQTGYAGKPLVTIDGKNAGSNANGLTLQTGSSQVKGFNLTNFSAAGIAVVSGTANSFQKNQIFNNGKLGIDLGADGVTANDNGDSDTGANNLQNFPVLTRAVPGTNNLTVQGRLNSLANQNYTLEFFDNTTCDPSNHGQGSLLLGSAAVTTGANGEARFTQSLPSVAANHFITATATGVDGTSEFSQCLVAEPGNDSWPAAYPLDPASVSGQFVSVSHFIDLPGQSRWYRFHVQPNSKVIVTLTGLPANYDLTLYKDIGAAFKTLTSPQDLNQLGAEFAADAFSPDQFSADAFSPDQFSADAFSADAFSPDQFSADVFSADQFSADAFSPDQFSADAFSADAFSADQFSADAFSADQFSPDAFSADQFSPDAFSGAQTRSLLGVSAHEGTASEGLQVNTWENAGDFYVRVRGRNGNFSLTAPFSLHVALLSGACSTVGPITTPTSLTAPSAGYHTIILTNPGLMAGDPTQMSTLAAKLDAFKSRPEVAGAVVDVSSDARVAAAYAQAAANPTCPYATNQVAEAIKQVVNRYQANNPLQYVVIVGSDNVIPFFRHPDHALLGNETNFVPPVIDNSPSQASLKLGYVLSQEDYGASTSISIKDDSLPIPGLAVGRLVENPADISHMLDVYTNSGGVVPTPSSGLVTGYDFLADGADAVKAQFEAGLGKPIDTLIEARGLAPTDPTAWTADQLRAQLLGQRHDLVYLAGHFSASSALAADYTTRLTTSDLINSTVDLTNSIVFSAGCHAGYNIVNGDAVVNVTRQPDWAVAFASKGATLIAGTGYQYGDTDFVEYSERLYLDFSQQLRTGSGRVSIGKALVEAKQAYLAGTSELRPIHEKVILESTLFGLPMLSVDLPGARLAVSSSNSIVSATQAVSANPGLAFGLQTADVNITPNLHQTQVSLTSVSGGTGQTATYLSGTNGVSANPAEPVLPLESRNVSVPGNFLRGIGFRGGSYTDLQDILPLTGAATTDLRGVHAPFISNVFFPVQTWYPNYFDSLSDVNQGQTLLNVLPAQFMSSSSASLTGTLRKFDQMKFRLYYNNNIQTYTGNSIPALSAAPTIQKVTASVTNGQINFVITVVGNPSAGVQNVWITYTATTGAWYQNWQSLDLTQNPTDSTQWTGHLPIPAGVSPDQVRYMVQAVNGVGLVSLSTQIGRYWTPGTDFNPTTPTQVQLTSASSGPYGTIGTYSAVLTSNGTPLANQVISFNLGPVSRLGVTDAAGSTTVNMPLLGLPGQNTVNAAFGGDAQYLASSTSGSITITPQDTSLVLAPTSVTASASDTNLFTATLTAAGRPLSQKTVFFVFQGPNGAATQAEITDYAGRATLPSVALPGGTYTLTVYFGGTIPLPGGGSLNVVDDRYHPSTTTGSLTLNAGPTAVDDSYATDEDTPLVVPAPGVLGNDTNGGSTALSASLVTGPTHGTLALNPDGSFTYTPAANYNGPDSFTYTANAGSLASQPATVSLTIRPVNDPPVAVDDSYNTTQDTTLTTAAPGVLANDTDVDSTNLTSVLNTGPAHGTLTLNADGSFTYKSNPGYHGTDSFTYKAYDGQAYSNVAKVTLNIAGVSQPPVCTSAVPSQVYFWPPNGNFVPVKVLGVTDPAGNPFTIRIDRIFQDEPVGPTATGKGIGTDTAWVASIRDNTGDGRVYHIFFTATNTQNASCSGEIRVAIAHDQGNGIDSIDGGALYDSTVPTP